MSKELKPLRWSKERASDPPAITMSASSFLSISAPRIKALRAEEQAVETVHVSLLSPQRLTMSSVSEPKDQFACMSGAKSILPTVVPEINTERIELISLTDNPASDIACRVA